MIPDLTERRGRYLSLAEREEISRGIAARLEDAEIARRVGRHRSSVRREIDRNHVVRERRGAHARGHAPAPTGPERPHRRVDARQARRDA